MIIKPTADNIIVKVVIEDKNKTESGIILPTKADIKPEFGEVVAIGEGRMLNNGTLLKSSLKVGSTVLFNKFAGVEVRANGGLCLIMKETDIMAVILKE